MNRTEYNNFSLISMENDILRQKLNDAKTDRMRLKKQVDIFLKEIACTFSGQLEDGAIKLSIEDQRRLLELIEK